MRSITLHRDAFVTRRNECDDVFCSPLARAFVVLGADQKLIPSARIETGAEIDLAKVSRDGKTLVGRVKDGNGYNLVIWDIPSRSTTILVKGADALGFSLLSDRSGLFACICNNHGKGLHDVDYFIWDIANKSKTKLIRLERTFVPAVSCDWSADGSLLTIADGNTKKVNLWKRDGETKRSALKSLDIGQRADVPKPAFLDAVLTPNGKYLYAFLPILDETSHPWSLAVEKWDIINGRKVPFPESTRAGHDDDAWAIPIHRRR